MERTRESTAQIIGKRLKELRKERDLSQKELCAAAGMNIQSYCYEKDSNVKIPSLETASKLAKVLICSPEYIMGDIDDRCGSSLTLNLLTCDNSYRTQEYKELERESLEKDKIILRDKIKYEGYKTPIMILCEKLNGIYRMWERIEKKAAPEN